MPKKRKTLDLWDFSKAIDNNWESLPHINLIIKLLHYGLAGQIENLAIALSPRLGKSRTVSEIFPAYVLGIRPYTKIILVTYTDDLATGFGGTTKDILDTYGYLFPENPKLKPDTKSKHNFKIDKNTGEYFCSGFKGGLLGRGGNIIIVDDPMKHILEARSPVYQEQTITLLNTAISTRREKDPYTGHNALTIITHQRLDEKDPIGVILEERDWISVEDALPRLQRGEKLGHLWVYLRLPELAEENDILGRGPGEALWPEKRSRKELLQIEKDIGQRDFSTLHQQDPKPKPGTYCNQKDFTIITEKPVNIIEEVQWSDLADTYYESTVPLSIRGASSASVRLGVTTDRKLVVTSLSEYWDKSAKVEPLIANDARIAGKNVKQRIPKDPGQASGTQIVGYSIRLPGYDFKGVPEPKNLDKEGRASSVFNWITINGIYVYDEGKIADDGKTPLVKRFIDQCVNFPSKQKDFVDAMSGAYSEIEIPEEEEVGFGIVV